MLNPLTACLFILTCKQQQPDTRAAPQLLFSHLAFTQIRSAMASSGHTLLIVPATQTPSTFALKCPPSRPTVLCVSRSSGGWKTCSSSVCSLSKLRFGFGFGFGCARNTLTTGQTQTPPSDIFTAREGNRLNIRS